MTEAKQLYVFKVDDRCLNVTGTAMFVADTKEEAREMFNRLTWSEINTKSAGEKNDNPLFIDRKYVKVLFHVPSKINRFMEIVWCLEYEFFLRVAMRKGLKSITYSD